MECNAPPPLTDEVLSLTLDGLIDDETQQHLAHCLSCRERLAEMQRLDALIVERLRRFECPSTQQLGDYHAGWLDTAEAEVVRQHVARCPRCQEELDMLNQFLNLPEEVPAADKIIPVFTAQNVFRGTRVEGSMALKGVDEEATFDVTAGSARIFIESSAVPEGFVLTGQVIDSKQSWVGAVAEIRQDGVTQQVRVLDEMCEFRFELSNALPVDLYLTSAGGTTIAAENIPLQKA